MIKLFDLKKEAAAKAGDPDGKKKQGDDAVGVGGGGLGRGLEDRLWYAHHAHHRDAVELRR